MFFTSDHGQPLGEGGAFFNHGYQTNVVRDPLLVFPPPSADHSPAARDSQWSEIATAQVSACDLAPTILHLMKASLAAPMDCVDWLAHAPKPRVRVVSAYTPTWVSEPTMLLLMPDGERALYELQHGTVTMNDGLERPMSEIGIPAEVSHRLH
jgi:arylsulfatase A-like enzyme